LYLSTRLYNFCILLLPQYRNTQGLSVDVVRYNVYPGNLCYMLMFMLAVTLCCLRLFMCSRPCCVCVINVLCAFVSSVQYNLKQKIFFTYLCVMHAGKLIYIMLVHCVCNVYVLHFAFKQVR
jgi:hypothetical protein